MKLKAFGANTGYRIVFQGPFSGFDNLIISFRLQKLGVKNLEHQLQFPSSIIFLGPVCDGTCKCLDRTTGDVAVSSEGYSLETSVVLPDSVFDSDNRLDCTLFTSDKANSASLADNLSEELFAQIESRK